MSKTTNNKMRYDIYVEQSNGERFKKFCFENAISINSMVNFLIVQFLLNDNTFKFVNPTKPMNKTIESNDECEDDHNNIVDILKDLMDGKDTDNNTDSIDYDF